LTGFIRRPEGQKKVDSKESMAFHSLKLALVIMRTSSIKKRMRIFRERRILTPVMSPNV